ncbi:MAG: hypothetical protein NVS1B7_2280 [Candidatus Saccharimonadales bacterium]
MSYYEAPTIDGELPMIVVATNQPEGCRPLSEEVRQALPITIPRQVASIALLQTVDTA